MTYVVTEKCIKCQFYDCVPVCPVDCFYEGASMLVIDPDVCIDCGVCELHCPAGAIIADTAEGAEKWVELNRQYAAIWPRIVTKKDPPDDANNWIDVENKYDLYFNPNPA